MQKIKKIYKKAYETHAKKHFENISKTYQKHAKNMLPETCQKYTKK